MAKKKTDKSYLAQVGAVAPAFAVKSILGDMPKGAIEKSIELRTAAKPKFRKAYSRLGWKPVSKRPTKKIMVEALKGRGYGRALGGGLGIATAPLYLKGIQLAGSKKKSDQQKGIALLATSGALYAGVKGGIEGTQEARAGGDKFRKALSSGKSTALSRMAYKPLGAIGLGMAVASKRRAAKEKKISPAMQTASLLGTGALVGAGSRGIDQAIKQYRKDPKSGRKLFKPSRLGKTLVALRPAMLGGAAGGAFGALALDKVVDWAEDSLKK